MNTLKTVFHQINIGAILTLKNNEIPHALFFYSQRKPCYIQYICLWEAVCLSVTKMEFKEIWYGKRNINWSDERRTSFFFNEDLSLEKNRLFSQLERYMSANLAQSKKKIILNIKFTFLEFKCAIQTM